MKYLFYFILLGFNFSVNAQQIEFEHSLTFAEGSMWSTEDGLQSALQVDKKDLPNIFFQKISPPLETQILTSEKNLFFNGKVKLYKKIQVCFDQKMGTKQVELAKLVQSFLGFTRFLFSSVNTDYRFSMEIVELDQAARRGCDIAFTYGDQKQFPYSRLETANHDAPKSWLNKVFAVFFQYDKDTLPIVAINPEVKIRFDYRPASYLSVENGQIILDGRTLINHEVGHLLGFKHISKLDSDSFSPELQVMGQHAEERNEQEVRLRFGSVKNLWNYWDYKQLSIFRQASALNQPRFSVKNAICLIPGDQFQFSGRLVEAQPQDLQLQEDSSAPALFNSKEMPYKFTRFFSNDQFGFFVNSDFDTHRSPGLNFVKPKVEWGSDYWRPVFKLNVLKNFSSFQILHLSVGSFGQGYLKTERVKSLAVAPQISDCF